MSRWILLSLLGYAAANLEIHIGDVQSGNFSARNRRESFITTVLLNPQIGREAPELDPDAFSPGPEKCSSGNRDIRPLVTGAVWEIYRDLLIGVIILVHIFLFVIISWICCRKCNDAKELTSDSENGQKNNPMMKTSKIVVEMSISDDEITSNEDPMLEDIPPASISNSSGQHIGDDEDELIVPLDQMPAEELVQPENKFQLENTRF
ncbi:hypothetical protein CAPTEDRAFT_204485 [Capitella teleta]|uniref:Uncharacterized protein n=1 Tax=Capitella teleta TaxID=283909 RepID=R7TCV1_CAPTE|nr:hypothetical protein CAPTEDRAFT_204485 [Capitella teleta]|eukprot:ELT91583.1 hypothetical protein CAPTEDRAFT_204485 [Capitella teleta]